MSGKKIILNSLIFLSFFLAFSLVNATTGRDAKTGQALVSAYAKTGQNWQCLDIKQLGGQSKFAPKGGAQIQISGPCSSASGCYLVICQGGNKSFKQEHKDQSDCVQQKGFTSACIKNASTLNDLTNNPAAQQNYIDGQNRRANAKGFPSGCTSGNIKVDQLLFGQPTVAKKGIIDFVIDTVKNLLGEKESTSNVLGVDNASPPLTPGQNDVTITAQEVGDEVPYNAYAVSLNGAGGAVAEVTQTPIITGTNNTQQLAELNTFSFNPKTVKNSKTNCTRIFWDPYGVVFDSQSLEPIPNAVVTILDSNKIALPQDEIPTNNDITGADGIFNILIDKTGDYYLSVAPYTDHEFTNNITLNPNYSAMYSDIYYKDQSFHENANEITHHDIPLQAKSAPFHSTPVIYPDSLDQKDLNQFNEFTGRVSHPLATVCLTGADSKVNYVCGQADRNGLFQLYIDKDKYPQEGLIPVAYKADPNDPSKQVIQSLDLSGQPTPIPESLVDQSEVIYEPILKYIEGYAYDNNGNKLTEATVNIKLNMNDATVYSIKTDDTGFFTIYSTSLPSLSYYIEIVPNNSGSPITITTSQFVSQNKSYLTDQKINLATATKNNQPIINSATGQLNEKSLVRNTIGNNEINSSANVQPFNPALILLMAIIFLLVAATIGLVLYIKKSKSI